MLRFSFTALVLAGALFGMAADSPRAGAGAAGSAGAPGTAADRLGRAGFPQASGTPAANLPTDCPCAGECGMAEQALLRDE